MFEVEPSSQLILEDENVVQKVLPGTQEKDSEQPNVLMLLQGESHHLSAPNQHRCGKIQSTIILGNPSGLWQGVEGDEL